MTPSIAIPVRIVDNLVIMSLWLNDAGPFEAVLDTGSSITVVAPELGASVGPTTGHSVTAAGLGAGIDATMHIVADTRLSWGDRSASAQLSGQTVCLLPIDYIEQQTGVTVSAILGHPVFGVQRVQVDYARATVTFDPAPETGNRGVTVPIHIAGDVPFVEAKLRGMDGLWIDGAFMLDMGTTSSLILSRTFFDTHPNLAEGGRAVRLPPIDAVGGNIALDGIRLAEAMLGGMALTAPTAVVPLADRGILANEGVAGIIGAEVLRRFTVTWDYAGSTMTLRPNTGLAEPFDADASGIRIVADKADLVVRAVMPDTPAAHAGVKIDDRLIAVDGTMLPLWKVKAALRQSGQQVELSILREGRPLAISMHLTRLI